MNGHLEYIVANLFMAIDELATAEGTIKDRLSDAYREHVSRVHMFKDSLSPETRGLLEKFVEAMTSVPARGGEGTVVATISEMEPERAKDLIRQIIVLAERAVSELAMQKQAENVKMVYPYEPSNN